MLKTLTLALLLSFTAFADETPPPLWENSAEASLLLTSGNTEVTTIGLGAASTYRPDPWALKGKGNFLTSKSIGVKTAESYDLSLRGERKIDDSLSGFLATSYLKNEFTGFQDRLGAQGGLSYLVLQQDGHSLSSELGAGVIKENLISGPNGTFLGSRTFVSGQLGLEYKWKISDSAELSDLLTLLENFSTTKDWRLSNTASITAILTQTFSLKLSYKVEHLNTPVAGKKSTDTTTTAALVAKF